MPSRRSSAMSEWPRSRAWGRYWPAGWIRSRPRLLEGMSAIWGSPENISSMGVFPSLTQLGHLTASRRISCVSVPTVDGHRAGFLLVGVRAAALSLPPWHWARSDPEGRLVLPRAEDEGPPMNIGMAEVHSWLPGQLFVGTFENRALSPSAIVGCVRMASRNPV